MNKVHYKDRKRNARKTIYLWVACKLNIYKDYVTDDPAKVTCKNCLRAMAKREREGERWLD